MNDRARALEENASRFEAADRRRRIRELPRRCAMLLDGLDNSDNDPMLVFDGLPFGAVMAAARRDARVYVAFQTLTLAQLARLFHVDVPVDPAPSQADASTLRAVA